MTTLMIKDLSVTEELDRTAMVAVHGGSIYVDGQYWGEGHPSFSSLAWRLSRVQRLARRFAHASLTGRFGQSVRPVR